MKPVTQAVIGGVVFTAIVAGLVLLVFLPMCSNKLSGEATVDGKPFVPDGCHSGQRWNFVGVEVTAKDGRRLRVAQTPDGRGVAFLFPAGGDLGVDLGACADLRVERQRSTINNVTNVEGSVALDCETRQGTASGRIEFENCH